jgi:hypothetical protein
MALRNRGCIVPNIGTIAGLAVAPSKLVNVPRVAASPASFECRLTEIIQLTGMDGRKAEAFRGDRPGSWSGSSAGSKILMRTKMVATSGVSNVIGILECAKAFLMCCINRRLSMSEI